jgi:catechol 2,3-dioxygenase-like lactoylglutathione lyase family enzyme
MTFPTFRQVVLDSLDVRRDAEFYRQLLGLSYAEGHEPPPDGTTDDADWLVLATSDGTRLLAFQLVDSLPAPTWPEPGVSQQLHLDFRVRSADELRAQHDRVLDLGGRLLQDRIDDPDEPIRVYADPSGHPFCVFVLA